MEYAFLDSSQISSEDFLQKFDKALEYLQSIKDVSKLVLDPRAAVAFEYVRSTSNSQDVNLIGKSNTIVEIIAKIISYNKNDITSYVNSYDTLHELRDAKGIETLYISQFQLNLTIAIICWNLSNRSKEFKYKFYDFKAFETILGYIKDENFLQNCIRFKHSVEKKDQPKPGIRLLRALIGTINNVSKIADDIKQTLQELNAAQIIMKFAVIMKDFPSHRMSAYMAAANMLNDNEIETLPDTKMIIEMIMSLIKICTNALKTKKGIQRDKVSIDGQRERNEVVFIVSTNMSNYHIIELLQVLYRISVNDKIKTELCETYKLNEHLEILILEGNLTEKEYSLRSLWQLCFQATIAQQLFENKKLYEYIVNNLMKKQVDNKNIHKFCDGIIWSVEKSKLQENIIIDSEKNEKKKHIMISYNSYSKEICLNIKRELESFGHKVWIGK
jgi:hypothetical protein